MSFIINDDYLSPQEAATALGVSKQRVYQLVRHGVLENVKYRNQLYISRASLAAFDPADTPGKGRPRKQRDIERDKAIGKRCREAREASGLVFGEAAKALGIWESDLSRKERGLRSMTQTDISAQATLYGVSAKWLENGSSE